MVNHSGTLVLYNGTSLANNLWTGGYALWTDYQAVDKGVLNDDDTRTCTFRPLHGSGAEIKIVKDLCLYCECLIAWVEVLDGVLRHEYLKNQCNTPMSVLCQKMYSS